MFDSGSLSVDVSSSTPACMQPSEQYCLDLANESIFSLVNLEQLRQEIIPSIMGVLVKSRGLEKEETEFKVHADCIFYIDPTVYML